MAAPPNEALSEHRATVCLPCPKCGNIIPSYGVRADARDRSVLSAECAECRWSAEASVATDTLGLTSLAMPAPPLPVRTETIPPLLDRMIFEDRAPASAPPPRPERLLTHGDAARRRLRIQRRRWEAWVLTAACFIALAMGTLDLVFLAHRMTTAQIVLVAVFLLPVVGVFLFHGLRGLWRDTRPA